MCDYWDSFDCEIQSDEFVNVYADDFFDIEAEECKC